MQLIQSGIEDNSKVAVMPIENWLDVLRENWELYLIKD
jgi:hypothetical protein